MKRPTVRLATFGFGTSSIFQRCIRLEMVSSGAPPVHTLIVTSSEPSARFQNGCRRARSSNFPASIIMTKVFGHRGRHPKLVHSTEAKRGKGLKDRVVEVPTVVVNAPARAERSRAVRT